MADGSGKRGAVQTTEAFLLHCSLTLLDKRSQKTYSKDYPYPIIIIIKVMHCVQYKLSIEV